VCVCVASSVGFITWRLSLGFALVVLAYWMVVVLCSIAHACCSVG
jgi:hypothetical protein